MINKKVIRKYVEYIHTKIVLLWEQKVFRHKGVRVKYMVKKEKQADTLAIVFSACTRAGLRARYNYVRTLNGLNCNRLYILDDYAADHRGSYYIGGNFKFDEEAATRALIQKVMEDLKPAKVVCCGSSKGGYAALNFGVEIPDSVMIVGAPQYFLTTYLLASGNLDTLDHILGQRNEEKDAVLEFYLRNKLKSNPNIETQKVCLHFSDKEHTYEEHIVHMLKDMEEAGYRIEKDVADYTNHSDVSYHFPDFLKMHMKAVIEQTK